MAPARLRDRLLDTLVVAAAVIALILAVSARWPRSLHRRSPIPEPMAMADWTTLSAEGHRIGPEDSDVTIVEFGDYECPACRRVHQILEQFLGDAEFDVSLVYRHWPLPQHPLGYPAARAAACAAEQGKFAPFHALLLETSSWQANPMGAFRIFADSVGVARPDEFDSCVSSLQPHPIVERDIAAAGELGATGTPTLIINGLILRSFPDSAALVGFITEARKRGADERRRELNEEG